jgi:hypothetical protein
VGYIFDENSRSWTQTSFQNIAKRYIFRPATEEERKTWPYLYPHESMWGVFGPGDKVPNYACDGGDNGTGSIVCGNGVHSLRFQTYYAGGYVSGRDDSRDTPAIEIGRCEMISAS